MSTSSCAIHVTIFNTGGKFQLVSNFMELHTQTFLCALAIIKYISWMIPYQFCNNSAWYVLTNLTMIWTQWFGQTAHHLSVFTSIQGRTGQREGSHLGTMAHRIYQMIGCTYTSSAPQEMVPMCGPTCSLFTSVKTEDKSRQCNDPSRTEIDHDKM